MVCIIGDDNIQNRLLTEIIQSKLDLQCRVFKTIDQIFQDSRVSEQSKIILIDAERRSEDDIVSEIMEVDRGFLLQKIVALFNLESESGLEKKVISLGIKGFFYKAYSVELFLKGISALNSGEYWISRDILFDFVQSNQFYSVGEQKDDSSLTRRETEILAMVCVGSTNDEIADKLCISTNTVKTHLYNVFKKIDVPNRMQAALWGAKNL